MLNHNVRKIKTKVLAILNVPFVGAKGLENRCNKVEQWHREQCPEDIAWVEKIMVNRGPGAGIVH